MYAVFHNRFNFSISFSSIFVFCFYCSSYLTYVINKLSRVGATDHCVTPSKEGPWFELSSRTRSSAHKPHSVTTRDTSRVYQQIVHSPLSYPIATIPNYHIL
ncbi:hypothetical protein N657DRAFT_430177 [Parathielavia appendiculata]|uniref:Uncharacterized protein n=1 Tax=Parathielavia appendiculata TaxID=2587402 RepID=A0AAN6Z3F9_9PEZI|nr:hypothetical protein N657DRAFT_430177 [Parathielavia appendiculata]